MVTVYNCAGCGSTIVSGHGHATGCMLREDETTIERRSGHTPTLPGTSTNEMHFAEKKAALDKLGIPYDNPFEGQA